MIEQTLVLVKPDGVKRGLIGEVISRFEKRGLKMVGIKMVEVDPDFSKKHYAAHVDKGFYAGVEKYITSGPVVAMIIEGINAIEVVRKIVGSTEPKDALLGSIRGDFAHTSNEYSDAQDKATENLIHASGDLEDSKKEVALWFSIDELHNYKIAHENHVM
jgi:nucleoside-diphosphate kinase